VENCGFPFGAIEPSAGGDPAACPAREGGDAPFGRGRADDRRGAFKGKTKLRAGQAVDRE